MVITDIDELQKYVHSAIKYQMTLQKIEMDENLGIFIVLIKEDTRETRTAYFGFDEPLHKKIAIETLKSDDSQIKIFGG